MFPHVEYNETGTEYEQWQVYDRHSRRGPVSFFIEELAVNTKRKMEDRGNFYKKLPSKKDIEKVASVLRGNFEILLSPKQRLGDTEELILSYTQEQYKFLDHLEDNERCLFQGAAGTGKTMLYLAWYYDRNNMIHTIVSALLPEIWGHTWSTESPETAAMAVKELADHTESRGISFFPLLSPVTAGNYYRYRYIQAVHPMI